MPRPAELPKLETIGARIKWWREYRGMGRKELAKLTHQAYSTLADLESGRSSQSEKLDLVAAHLKLNPFYLRTDKGDPEATVATAEPPVSDWPLDRSLLAQVRDLDDIEMVYFAIQAKEALQNIENARNRKYKKRG
jgi:transcriptional regulator with XRE-family HTH domain